MLQCTNTIARIDATNEARAMIVEARKDLDTDSLLSGIARDRCAVKLAQARAKDRTSRQPTDENMRVARTLDRIARVFGVNQ